MHKLRSKVRNCDRFKKTINNRDKQIFLSPIDEVILVESTFSF